jgi:hypothetical protein
MPEETQELKLNPAKLARLVTHLKEGGEKSTKAAESVLRMRKPNYVKAYIEEAMRQTGLEAPSEEPTPEPAEEPTPEPAEEPTPEPAEEASTATVSAPPADVPAAVDSPDKAYRFRGKDGQSIKLKIASETAKAVIFEEDVPQDLVTIMVKGVAAQVNALDPDLSPEVRTAINLARS